MAYRGRGRGRGMYRGGGGGYAKQEPFVLFPEIELPHIDEYEKLEGWKVMARSNFELTKWWRSSSYYLENPGSNDDQDEDIERFSDKFKPKKFERGPVDEYLQLGCTNFPSELIEGLRTGRRKTKKVRWSRDQGVDKLDLFEKLEEKFQGKDGENEQKEDDEGEEEGADEDEEEYSDDGDYNQNRDFDDDEDDYNMDDGGDDEPAY